MIHLKPITAMIFLLLAGLAQAQGESPPEQGIPDTDLGLSKTSVFEVQPRAGGAERQ
jgi:hypothetical protein